ncbi:low temperature requirement protein A [Deinococcus koreensis]|nr:low temperature requirement protein A [Deinococcus koreensis]
MTAPTSGPQETSVQRVRPLELFFDLVFVYTITHLTNLIAHPHGALDYLQAALIFLSLMWMYDGFVWLSSNLELDADAEYWLMFAAMVTFFVMALGIPTIRGDGGVVFGLGLLLVTALHTGLFSRSATSSAQAIWGIAPYNFASALLVFSAAFVGGVWHWALWLAAIGVLILATLKRREQAFALSPRHFAERHGLLIIIALGESVVALGLGAAGLPITPGLLAYAALGLLLAALVWWSYFGPDHERAERAFERAGAADRNRMALRGYGYSHMGMMSGIIMIAAGLEVGIHGPGEEDGAAWAWNLAVGLALYFLSDVAFRRSLGLGPGRLRLLVGALALATVPVGLSSGPLWQLLAAVLVVALLSVVEDYVLPARAARRGPP